MKTSLSLSRREKLLLGLLSSTLLFSFSFSYGAVSQSKVDSIVQAIDTAGKSFSTQADKDTYYQRVYTGLSDAIDMLGVVRNVIGTRIGTAPVDIPPVINPPSPPNPPLIPPPSAEMSLCPAGSTISDLAYQNAIVTPTVSSTTSVVYKIRVPSDATAVSILYNTASAPGPVDIAFSTQKPCAYNMNTIGYTNSFNGGGTLAPEVVSTALNAPYNNGAKIQKGTTVYMSIRGKSGYVSSTIPNGVNGKMKLEMSLQCVGSCTNTSTTGGNTTSQSTPKNFCKNGAGPHMEFNIDDNARFFSTGPRDGAGGDLFRTYGSGDVFVIKINVPAGYKYAPPAGRPDVLPVWGYTNSPVTHNAERTVSVSRNLCDFDPASAQVGMASGIDGVAQFHIEGSAGPAASVASNIFSLTPGYSYYLNVKNGPCKTGGNSTGYQGCHFDSQFKNWTGVNRAPGLVPGGSTTGISGVTGGGTSSSNSPWAPFGATDPWCPTSAGNGDTLYPKAAKWHWKNIGNVFFNDYTLPTSCTTGDEFLLHEGTTGQACTRYKCK